MPSTTDKLLNAPLATSFRVAMVSVIAFGLFMLALLVGGVYMAERTLDSGIAPMQELMLIQKQTSQALQLAKSQDQWPQDGCSASIQNEICEMPLLLQNVMAAAQRLLDGDGGLTGLPAPQALQGQARTVALALRDRASSLVPISHPTQVRDTASLLRLQRGLLEISTMAHELEHILLHQLRSSFRTKHWLDLLAVTTTGVLMAGTVTVLFWMWFRVRSAFHQVQTSEGRLRAYADAVPDTAYVLDETGRVLEIMGRAKNQADHPPLIPPGDRLQDHRPIERVETYLNTVRQALATGEVQTLESEVADARGELRWYEARVAVIDDRSQGAAPDEATADQRPRQVIWLTRDVTGRIQTEQQLRQLNEELEHRVAHRTQELNDAADELRSFNYTVSHDLRAPLRAMEAYTALAVEEAGDSLKPTARELLERARKSAAQLSHMVESLLKLSRIGEIPLQCTWLDLSAMATEICMAFSIDQKDHRIDWQVDPGQAAWGDEHLMRSVLQNLINNAVKYSARREPAQIAVGQARLSDGTTAFYVRDNGAGFDMARASQLFQPFTRLHSGREFSGDGIGLATVRRIVMRHGGRVWAQGQVNVGATVWFSIPAQAQD